MNLSEAAVLTGLTVSGIRARAKKDPEKYGLERDNAGRIWLTFDADGVQPVNPVKAAFHPSGELSVQSLEALLHEVRQDRDHWRRMAETLAARRRRFWPWS